MRISEGENGVNLKGVALSYHLFVLYLLISIFMYLLL